MRYGRGLVGIFFSLLLLAGCGQTPLHHNLSEPDADKILVLLDAHGITAEKKKAVEGQEVSWTVVVSKGDLPQARRLLVESNLPARPELGLSGVYQEKGLIPTPDEQRARFLLALKGEIVNALRKIPGVHEVGVVLNIPAEKELAFEGEEKGRPAASVTLRIAEPGELTAELTEEKIRRFVANAIPGMSPNDVIVIISSAGRTERPSLKGAPPREGFAVPAREEPPAVAGIPESETPIVTIAGIRLEEESLKRFKIYLVVFLCVLILLSAALLVTLVRMNRLRHRQGSRRLKAVSVEGGEGPGLLTGGGQR